MDLQLQFQPLLLEINVHSPHNEVNSTHSQSHHSNHEKNSWILINDQNQNIL